MYNKCMVHKSVSFLHEFILGVKPKKRYIASLLMFIYLLMIGTAFYSQEEHWSIVDSFYFSSTTLATVGFGDLHPTNPISKIFTVFYIFIGVGLGIYTLSMLGESLLE